MELFRVVTAFSLMSFVFVYVKVCIFIIKIAAKENDKT